MKTSFYQYSLEDLFELFKKQDLHPAGVSRLYNWHYKKKKITPCVDDIAKKTIDFVEENFDFSLPRVVKTQISDDKTVKLLFELEDKFTVESVIIPFQGKYTVCLSSQVGCAMNCSFCHTGLQGLKRQLKTEEIIGQFMSAQLWLLEHRPDDFQIQNVVFMGQGEPLHNFEAVKKSCEIFLSQHGLSLADHKITISTAGYLPGLKRWVTEGMPDVNIALSLHSPFKDKRDKLIPINKNFDLSEVLPVVDSIPTGRKRFVTYEYLLIKDFNDSLEDAHATGKLLAGKKAFINLIPFNPFPLSSFERPEKEQIEIFRATLESYKIPTLVRVTKGDEILAACGQLNTGLKKQS